MKFEDRFRHFYCIGQTGTGKTTNLLTMAKEDLKNGYGFCFIDPHGDFCEDLLSYFPKDRIDDLIYFNVADFNYPLGLNVFEAQTEEEKDVIISDLIDMFVAMYGHEIF
jgi:DNA helicase HerA-like ATPase